MYVYLKLMIYLNRSSHLRSSVATSFGVWGGCLWLFYAYLFPLGFYDMV